MYDVEKICELQRKLDEYERFNGELFLMLYNRDVKRQFVRFIKDDVPFCDDIIEQVKRLIEEVKKC
jgi:hypothetical protein